MSKETDAVIKFRELFDAKMDKTIESYEKRKQEEIEKNKDNPFFSADTCKSLWDSKIRAFKFAKDMAMCVESQMIADHLNRDIDELHTALCK